MADTRCSRCREDGIAAQCCTHLVCRLRIGRRKRTPSEQSSKGGAASEPSGTTADDGRPWRDGRRLRRDQAKITRARAPVGAVTQHVKLACRVLSGNSASPATRRSFSGAALPPTASASALGRVSTVRASAVPPRKRALPPNPPAAAAVFTRPAAMAFELSRRLTPGAATAVRRTHVLFPSAQRHRERAGLRPPLPLQSGSALCEPCASSPSRLQRANRSFCELDLVLSKATKHETLCSFRRVGFRNRVRTMWSLS